MIKPLRRFIDRVNIARKISLGYVLAGGLATCGTSIGLWIGESYQQSAQQILLQSEHQDEILRNLEVSVLEARSHPQRLLTVLGDSIWFQYETVKLKEDVQQILAFADELEQFVEQYSTSAHINKDTLRSIADGYQATAIGYQRWVQTLWQTLDPANVQDQNLATVQQQLLTTLTKTEVSLLQVQFERLDEQLQQNLKNAREQRSQAQAAFRSAERLRLLIISGSMLVSAVLSALLVYFISRAIAQPVQDLTEIAEQVVEESNFELKVAVTTRDEVGVLTESFNQLIQWVGQYTRALETSQTELQGRTEELTLALADLKKMQLQLIQTEKMSSLGQTVAGVAHEINNPVNFIHGNLDHANQYAQELLGLLALYQAHYPSPVKEIHDAMAAIDLNFVSEDFNKLLRSMKDGTNRIRQIVLSLRNFSRLDEAEVKDVDLHEGIESTLVILQNRLKAKPDRPEIQVVKLYADLPKITCYPSQLNQVFINILGNAIDDLETAHVARQARSQPKWVGQILIQTSILQNGWIEVQISDNGSGIPEDIQSRIFDPFFTTKQIGQGTGLGLSISYQIVTENHRGCLFCNSKPGQGTTFTIQLPIDSSKPETTGAIARN